MRKKKNKKFKQYEKLLRKDEDFDFSFLLELERFKLKRMIKNFEEASQPHYGIEKKIEEMKMCVKLLDIIFEDDAPSRMYWDAYSKIQLFTVAPPDKDGLSELIPTGEKPPKFPVHINTKNGKRFNKYWDENLEPIIQPELRRVKALHLYNKLRNRCFGWWW